MTLEEFDRRIERAARYRSEARKMLATADNIEQKAIEEAGVVEHEREPGFNRWEAPGEGGYYATPRQALEAAIKRGVAWH